MDAMLPVYASSRDPLRIVQSWVGHFPKPGKGQVTSPEEPGGKLSYLEVQDTGCNWLYVGL